MLNGIIEAIVGLILAKQLDSSFQTFFLALQRVAKVAVIVCKKTNILSFFAIALLIVLLYSRLNAPHLLRLWLR